MNGTTWIQPDELEESIKKSGEWTNEKYDIFKHNCHDFVRECLKIIGCHETMIIKNLPVYRPCKNGGIWNLWNLSILSINGARANMINWISFLSNKLNFSAQTLFRCVTTFRGKIIK